MITNNQFVASMINDVVSFACSRRIVPRYLRNTCAFIYYYSYPCPFSARLAETNSNIYIFIPLYRHCRNRLPVA